MKHYFEFVNVDRLQFKRKKQIFSRTMAVIKTDILVASFLLWLTTFPQPLKACNRALLHNNDFLNGEYAFIKARRYNGSEWKSIYQKLSN